MVTPDPRDVTLAMRVHAEVLHELTGGKPGEATSAQLMAAMRAALAAIHENKRAP